MVTLKASCRTAASASCRSSANPVRWARPLHDRLQVRAGASPTDPAEDWAYGTEKKGWFFGERATAKASLKPGFKPNNDKNDTVSDTSLTWVEFVHWIFFVPPMYLSYMLFAQGPTSVQTFCLMVFPLIQAIAAVAPMALHEYEGWQIAPYKEPSDQSHPGKFLPTFNNQWLRQVVLRYLLMFQGCGLMLFNLGVWGMSTPLAQLYTFVCVLSVVAMLLGPKRAFHVSVWWGPQGEPPIPLPSVWVMVPFVAHAIANVLAFAYRLGVWETVHTVITALPCARALPAWLGSVVGSVVTGLCVSLWFGFCALACLVTLYAALRNGSYTYNNKWQGTAALLTFGYVMPALLVGAYFCNFLAADMKALMFFWIPGTMVQVGGTLEAFFTETVWDQWMHASAVSWMIGGFISMILWLGKPAA